MGLKSRLTGTATEFEVPETKVRQIFLEDPEGVLIELIYLPGGKRF